MASITLRRALFLTAFQAIGDVVTVTFEHARRLTLDGGAFWSTLTSTQEFSNANWQSITSLTGAGLASLDSVLLRSAKIGDELVVYLTVDAGAPRRYRVVASGVLVANADSIISPPDFDATANDKYLLQVS